MGGGVTCHSNQWKACEGRQWILWGKLALSEKDIFDHCKKSCRKVTNGRQALARPTGLPATLSLSSSLCEVRYEYLLFECASGCTEPPGLLLPSITRLAEPCELAPSVLQCSWLFPGGAVIPLEGELGEQYCKYKMFFLSA